MSEFTIKVQVPEGWEPDEPNAYRWSKIGEHELHSGDFVCQVKIQPSVAPAVIVRQSQCCRSCEMATYHEFDQNYVICRPTLPRWVSCREHVMPKTDGATCPTYRRRSKT